MAATVEHMLNYLLDLDDDVLNEWELEFVNNIAELEEGESLSPTRLAKLKEIYDEH